MTFFTALVALTSLQQGWPQTTPEKTNYEATSTYQDVLDFIGALQANGAPIHLSFTGTSTEGRRMPLAVIAWPPVASPGEAKRSGKPVVYIQGNIHAGEVEGKESAQNLLRRLAQEVEQLKQGKTSKTFLVDKLVFVVNPIYNADGNEKFGPVERNRPEQIGPKMVGVRPNGQNFDLNRDCIKAESPEMRAVLSTVYGKWDPDVIFDLHTTDGTRHGYDLTYSPALNPNTDQQILKFSRDEMLPFVRRDVAKRFGLRLFDYGDISTRGGQQVFATFASEGRYVTNYGGLRNRICVLSEAVTYIPFKDRIEATDKFMAGCLEYIAARGKQVVEIIRNADARTVSWGLNPSKAPALGVRFEPDSRGVEEVIFEKPIRPRPKGRPVDLIKAKMPIIDRFKSSRTARFPAAYAYPAEYSALTNLLQAHGIAVTQTTEEWKGKLTTFEISERAQDQTMFQGHFLVRIEGKFSEVNGSLPKGTMLVRTSQPLGLLAFHILEPEMTDGAGAWGFLPEWLMQAGTTYPVAKVMTPPVVRSEQL